MRKLFKKSIACVLAAILCVSLCVCAIPASAEAIQFSTNAVTAKAGDAVVIDFEIADFAAVKAAQIKLVLPEAIASIDSVSLNGDALVATEDVFEIGEGYVKLQALFGDSEYDDFAAADSLVLSIAATVADVEADTYAYGESVVNLYSETAALEVEGAFGEFKVVEEAAGPVVDEGINISGIILIDATLGVFNTITGVDAYDDFEIVVTKNVYSTTDYNVESVPVTVGKDKMTYYKGSYFADVYGFALTDLCLDVTAVVNCYDADGNLVAVSNPYTTTIKDLAVALYDSTDAVVTKTLLTDLLNMGSEAMAYFAGRFPSSALAAVAEEAYPNYGFDQTYASESAPELTLGEGQTSNTGATITGAVTVLQSAAVGYVIKPATTPADLNVEVTYYNTYKKEEVKATATAADMTLYKGSYFYNFADLPLFSSNAVVSITVKDGDTVLGTHTYTVEQGVDANADEALDDIFDAIAKFGASARAYFEIA